jgi:hypothetical protein
MGPAQRSLHLLFLDESSADHLVDRRLHECRANRFPLPSTLAEVRDELAVIADVFVRSRYRTPHQRATRAQDAGARTAALTAHK